MFAFFLLDLVQFSWSLTALLLSLGLYEYTQTLRNTPLTLECSEALASPLMTYFSQLETRQTERPAKYSTDTHTRTLTYIHVQTHTSTAAHQPHHLVL